MNPYTDFGFKRLFGMEANRDLLVDFLNQLLPPEHQIVELVFSNPEKLPELPFLRKAIFDMPLFTKTESELKTRYDKWCYFLKNLENFDHIPSILNEPVFEKALQISEIGAMSKVEYATYQETFLPTGKPRELQIQPKGRRQRRRTSEKQTRLSTLPRSSDTLYQIKTL